jgi:MmyB-like transcription regulator ligand binding domain
MIARLAVALRLPLREQGDLLEVAGYARQVRESELAAPPLEPARRAIAMMLAHHEPLPAVVMDRHWNLIDSNRGAARFFWYLLDAKPFDAPNILHLMFDPEALRPWVMNWDEVATALLRRVHDEAVGGILDSRTKSLLRALKEYPGTEAVLRPHIADTAWPLLPVRFEKLGQRFEFFSMVTTLGTPRDVALQGLRIESFFPVDEMTRLAVQRLEDAPRA